MTRSTYNENKFMVFYKDGGLFQTEMTDQKELNETLAWHKKGGFKSDMFIICHYDYMAEEFFEVGNESNVIGFDRVNRGVMKPSVLTKFRGQFFTGDVTRILNQAGY